MKHPTNIFTALPYDDSRVLLQVTGAAGQFQIPMEKEQAELLAKQLFKLAQDSEKSNEAKMLDYLKESMVFLPKGQLWMGSMPAENIPEDELPRHPVKVDAFHMSAFLVTQGLWRYVMGSNPSLHKGLRKPVHQITWFDAIAFCNALSKTVGLEPVYVIESGVVSWNRSANGYRLPTEVEWEYAARTRDDLRYSGADTIAEVGWIEGMTAELPEIAQKEPNLWGFHDLSGLLWEWCWDDFAPYLVSKSEALQSENVESGAVESVVGQYSELLEKSCRGGAWNASSQYARCTARYSQPPTTKGEIGLRVVRSV